MFTWNPPTLLNLYLVRLSGFILADEDSLLEQELQGYPFESSALLRYSFLFMFFSFYLFGSFVWMYVWLYAYILIPWCGLMSTEEMIQVWREMMVQWVLKMILCWRDLMMWLVKCIRILCTSLLIENEHVLFIVKFWGVMMNCSWGWSCYLQVLFSPRIFWRSFMF